MRPAMSAVPPIQANIACGSVALASLNSVVAVDSSSSMSCCGGMGFDSASTRFACSAPISSPSRLLVSDASCLCERPLGPSREL